MRRGIRSVRCLPERPSGRWRCVLRLRGCGGRRTGRRVGSARAAADRVRFVDALRWLRAWRPGTERVGLTVNPRRPGGGGRVAKRRAEQHRWRRGPRHVLRNRLLIQCVAAYVDGIRVRSSFLTLLFRRRLALDRLPAWPGRAHRSRPESASQAWPAGSNARIKDVSVTITARRADGARRGRRPPRKPLASRDGGTLTSDAQGRPWPGAYLGRRFVPRGQASSQSSRATRGELPVPQSHR